MPLQNGRAIKATAKYKDESDTDWMMTISTVAENYQHKPPCLCVNKEYLHW